MTKLYELKRVDLHTDRESAVFVGTRGEVWETANAWGYRWRDSDNIFGGYFVNAEGDCLFVDIHVDAAASVAVKEIS